MRHRKRRTRFGRQPSHRKATLKSLAKAVLLHEKIQTTHTKAKEARRLVEKLITIAKEQDSVALRRRAFAVLGDRTLVSKLFKDIAPRFTARKGGYTRIIPFNFRKGDGASMVFLELTERKPEEKAKVIKKAKKKEAIAKPKPAAKEHPKSAPEIEPQVQEEKTVEDVKRKRARDEDRKIEKQKGFLRKVRGFFRRKTNM